MEGRGQVSDAEHAQWGRPLDSTQYKQLGMKEGEGKNDLNMEWEKYMLINYLVKDLYIRNLLGFSVFEWLALGNWNQGPHAYKARNLLT